MELIQFNAAIPTTDENGIVWDKYYLVNLVISSDVATGNPSLYGEFWLCRDVIIDGVSTKEIKRNLEGYEVKSIMVNNIFEYGVEVEGEENTQVLTIMNGLMAMLEQVGIQQGFLKE